MLGGADHEPVAPVQLGGVEVGRLQHPAELAGQDDVGVHMQPPLSHRQFFQAAVDHPPLVERPAADAARRPLMILAEHSFQIVDPADLTRLLIALAGDDDPAVELPGVVPGRLSQEIGVPHTNCHSFDSHLVVASG